MGKTRRKKAVFFPEPETYSYPQSDVKTVLFGSFGRLQKSDFPTGRRGALNGAFFTLREIFGPKMAKND